MALFNFGKKKKSDPVPELTDERIIPKKDILSVQTFTQSKTFRGYRRVRISTNGLDGVEKNQIYFRERGFDFTNSAVQLMTVKANNDFGKCLRIVVDGRFLGNIYRSGANDEAFDKVLDKAVDKVYVKLEDTIIDGQYYGTESYIMMHWPGIAPKLKVTVE